MNIWKQHKKYLLLATIFITGSCFATQEGELIQNIISVMDLVFALLSMLMTPMVILSGWLLSPDWTMGDFFGLRPYFREVWILVSNFVYIAFALMLLYTAVVQIFGGGESEYAYKKKLPDFLVGILLVPFTWLIVSWTLSFANQAVAAVLSIPMGAITQLQTDNTGDKKDKGIFHERRIPRHFSVSFGEGNQSSIDCSIGGTNGEKPDCISAAEFIAHNDAGPFFIIMVYAYDIFKIQNGALTDLSNKCTGKDKDGKEVSQVSKACITDLAGVARKFGLAIITTLFFSILLVALCWVLLMRAIKLWIYIMFSPLFGLAYFTGNGFSEAFHSEGGGGESSGLTDDLGFKNFFKLAMVPVLVSAVLAFGLLFVGVIQSTFDSVHTKNNTAAAAASAEKKPSCTTGDFMVKYCITPKTDGSSYSSKLVIGNNTTDEKGNLVPTGQDAPYTINFDFGDGISDFVAKSGTGGVIDGTTVAAQDIFAQIILTIIALAIIWMGIKAAVSYDKVTEMAFKPFAAFGESVSHFVQHAPSYIPLPHPAFKALTPSGMQGIADAIRQKVDTHEMEERRSLSDIMNVPGLSKSISDLERANGDFAASTEALRNTSKQQLATAKAQKTVQKNLESHLDNLSTSSASIDAGGAHLTAKDLASELKKARGDSSEQIDVLNKYKPLIDKLNSSSDTKEKVVGEYFKELSSKLGATGSAAGAVKPKVGGVDLDVAEEASTGVLTMKVGSTDLFKINKDGKIASPSSAPINSQHVNDLKKIYQVAAKIEPRQNNNDSEMVAGLTALNIPENYRNTPAKRKALMNSIYSITIP